MLKPHGRIFIRLDTISERDERMDRQTDGRNYSALNNADAL